MYCVDGGSDRCMSGALAPRAIFRSIYSRWPYANSGNIDKRLSYRYVVVRGTIWSVETSEGLWYVYWDYKFKLGGYKSNITNRGNTGRIRRDKSWLTTTTPVTVSDARRLREQLDFPQLCRTSPCKIGFFSSADRRHGVRRNDSRNRAYKI